MLTIWVKSPRGLLQGRVTGMVITEQADPSGKRPDTPKGTVEPASYLLDAVVRLMRGAHQTGNVRLRPWNITLSSYAALRVIADQPNLTLAQLSRRNFVRPQTMTRIVSELVKRGWIERRTRADDERAMALSLTEQGRTALHQMAKEVDKINETIRRVLADDQIEQVNALLRSCARQVETELGALSPPDAIS